MNKRKIEITEYTDVITSALKKGVFLTSKVGDKVNTMVIGWGHVGRIWERPVFIAYIRDIRYTREMLDINPEFTVNIPVNGFSKEAFAICGTDSGRNMDKIKEAVPSPASSWSAFPDRHPSPGLPASGIWTERRTTFQKLPSGLSSSSPPRWWAVHTG